MEDSDIHKKLYDASSDGAETRVRELLAAGADPNKYKDSYGDTALHLNSALFSIIFFTVLLWQYSSNNIDPSRSRPKHTNL